MMPSRITVDLRKTPEKRWKLSPKQAQQARELMRSYVQDLGGLAQFEDLLDMYAQTGLPAAYYAEVMSLARMLQTSPEEALLGNLYYDAVKFVFGCTAFATDTPDGPIHARNLDWWTENGMLASYTMVTDFIHGPNGHRYTTVGWPGFAGALSGVAHGRFAITLNAVLSNDPPELAPSISFVIRSVLEESPSFAAAVDILASQPIATDCLLLVSGINAGEFVVIERTPTKGIVRTSEQDFIAVANDYLIIDADTGLSSGELHATSCQRFDCATEHLGRSRPTTAEGCFAILTDPKIQMGITVQQMVLHAQKGLSNIRIPSQAMH